MIKKLIDRVANLLHKYQSVWLDDDGEIAAPAQDSYQYRAPQNIESLPLVVQTDILAIINQQAILPDRYIYRLNNVNVSWHGMVFSNFRIFEPSLLHRNVLTEYTDSFLLKQWVGDYINAPTNDAVIVVHNQYSAINYFHWLIEALPRLLLAGQVSPNSYLLVPAPVPEFIAMTAQLLGFSKLLPLNRNQILRKATVIMPEATHVNGHQDPVLMLQVRQQLLKGDSYNTCVVPMRRIYVSRSKQHMRKLLNEDDLKILLDKYNFEIVFFEELSFLQQMQLSLETSILMGVHGANLTNMLFMQPHTRIIELMNENESNLVYFRMASYLSIDYYNMPCMAVDMQERNNSNLIVDVASLNSLLQSFL